MGLWFWTAVANKHTEICEEIAKELKVDVKLVEKHYKEMLENIEKELEENKD